MRRSLLLVLLGLLLLPGCIADPRPGARAEPRESAAATSGAVERAAPASEVAEPTPAPEVGQCYRLSAEDAGQPTNDAAPVRCTGPHTSQTFHVGGLDTVVDGHLLGVDSAAAQDQVATTCRARLPRYLGGSSEQRELTRFAAVWFGPTVADSDLGANWFRCDLVVIASPGALAELDRRIPAAPLERAPLRSAYALCGTAAPGAPGFERVICSRPHGWQALGIIPLAGDDYPGPAAVRRAGQQTCRNQVRQSQGFSLRFQFGWEWPTREQWDDGQRFGYCWAPAD